MSEKLEAFAEWIVAQGGQRLEPTNEWEVLRYRKADNCIGIVWKNKKGAFTYSKQFGNDYPRFLKEAGLAKTERVDRLRSDRNRALKVQLAERDGDTCVYCGQFMTEPTLEHFHALSRHGTNHPDNAALSCVGCNLVVGNLPVIEKIKLRDRIRAAVAALPPWDHFDARTMGEAA